MKPKILFLLLIIGLILTGCVQNQEIIEQETQEIVQENTSQEEAVVIEPKLTPEQRLDQVLIMENIGNYPQINFHIDTRTQGGILCDQFTTQYQYKGEWNKKFYNQNILVLEPQGDEDIITLFFDFLAQEERKGNMVRLSLEQRGTHNLLHLGGIYGEEDYMNRYWISKERIYLLQSNIGDYQKVLDAYLLQYPSEFEEDILQRYKNYVLENNIGESLVLLKGELSLPSELDIRYYQMEEEELHGYESGTMYYFMIGPEEEHIALNVFNMDDSKTFFENEMTDYDEEKFLVSYENYNGARYLHVVGQEGFQAYTWYDAKYAYGLNGGPDLSDELVQEIMDYYPSIIR